MLKELSKTQLYYAKDFPSIELINRISNDTALNRGLTLNRVIRSGDETESENDEDGDGLDKKEKNWIAAGALAGTFIAIAIPLTMLVNLCIYNK